MPVPPFDRMRVGLLTFNEVSQGFHMIRRLASSFLSVLVLLPLGACTALAQTKSKLPASTEAATQPIIVYDLAPLKQTKNNDCWAVVFTMLQNWKLKEHKTTDEAMKTLGGHFAEVYTSDVGMDENDKKNLANAISLHVEYGQSFMPDALEQWLRQRGPLWFTTKGKDNNSHANLVIGLLGTGKWDGTFVRTIDPADGQTHTESFVDFMKRYEPAADFEGTWLYIISFEASEGQTP